MCICFTVALRILARYHARRRSATLHRREVATARIMWTTTTDFLQEKSSL